MLVVGGLLGVGGLMMVVTGRGAERGAGAATALFFFACLLTAPLFAPGRRGGPLRLETVRLGDHRERGILVPYSGRRMAMVLGATACLTLAMLGFVVFADAFADDPGESPWPVRLVGAVGAAFTSRSWSGACRCAEGGTPDPSQGEPPPDTLELSQLARRQFPPRGSAVVRGRGRASRGRGRTG